MSFPRILEGHTVQALRRRPQRLRRGHRPPGPPGARAGRPVSTGTKSALVTSLRPGDIIRVEGEVVEVMARMLMLRKRGDGHPRVMVRRLDRDGRCANLRFEFDHDKVEVLERAANVKT